MDLIAASRRVLSSFVVLGALLAALTLPAAASTPSAASCSPSGGTVAVNSTVNCTFTGGTDGSMFMFWSAPGFSPQSNGSQSPTFTAARAGSGSITAHWSVPGLGSQAATFTYTIAAAGGSPTSSGAACSPASGTVTLGSTVSCTFTSGTDGSMFMFWSAPGFTPQSNGSTSANFTASHAGPASITAYWSVPGLGSQTQTFSYTIS